MLNLGKFNKILQFSKEILRKYKKFLIFLQTCRTFWINKKCNWFEKLLKFEICLKIRMVLKNLTKIIKTLPKKFNEIHQSLSKFITV